MKAYIRAVVLDVEGTTTELAFVRSVLFPDAQQQLSCFLKSHDDDPKVAALLEELATMAKAEDFAGDVCAFVHHCIDEDRKLGPLKALQGLIWEEGYRDGRFEGHVYPEVPRRLENWRCNGLRLYIYSSGSVQAQKLLFEHSCCGDLTRLFDGHFDTNIGPKNDPASYRKIADAIDCDPDEIMFLTDSLAELDAAAEAGLNVTGLCRDGDPPESPHRFIRSFEEIGC